jgi:hypothetical protein
MLAVSTSGPPSTPSADDFALQRIQGWRRRARAQIKLGSASSPGSASDDVGLRSAAPVGSSTATTAHGLGLGGRAPVGGWQVAGGGWRR